MNSTEFPFKCLKCQGQQYTFLDRVTCVGCNAEYPVVAGIPILTNHPSSFLAESFYLYYSHIRSVDHQVTELENNFMRYPGRHDIRNCIINAMRANQRHVGKITDLLKPHLEPADLLNVQINPHNDVSRSLKDFDYLRRDWSGHPENEFQIGAIMESLLPALLDPKRQKESCLVLGAGTGRIANEISPYFERTFATDLSFSMAYHFNEIIKNDISFFEINTANLVSRDRYVRKVDCTYLPTAAEMQQSSQIADYFVSDVQELPLQDDSMSCVLSVYFTDVLALRLWIGEVCRVLTKGGIFMHFGPLGYPFKNLAEKLSAEEIRQIFEESNFTILNDSYVETPHLASSMSMARVIYDNWVFVARYEGKDLSSLTGDSIPYLQDPISYELTGNLTETEEWPVNVKVFATGMQTITGTGFLWDVLKNTDGVKTISEIFRTFVAKYDVQDHSETDLINLFQSLDAHGIVRFDNN